MLVRNQCISDYTSHFEIHIGPFRRNSTCIERSVTKQFSNGNYASPGRLQTWGFDKVQALVSSGKPSHWQCVLLGFFVGGVEPKWATQKKKPAGLLVTSLGGGFKHFLFSPRSVGKWFPLWRAYFSKGLKPPTRWFFAYFWVDSYRLYCTSLSQLQLTFWKTLWLDLADACSQHAFSLSSWRHQKLPLVFVMFIQDLEDFPDAIGLKEESSSNLRWLGCFNPDVTPQQRTNVGEVPGR